MSKFDALTSTFSGDIVLPSDSEYDKLSATHSHKGKPALIVKPKTSQDVAVAVEFAHKQSMTLSVRSGGHDVSGYGTNNDGMVIDLSAIDDIEIVDKEKHIIRIGSGATWGKVAENLREHKLAISSGDSGTVGVGGLTLGGGMGWMVRKYGLAIDSLVGAEVITADGSIVTASAEENEDLFWAVRGGGGNFGVVAHFDFVAKPVARVIFGSVVYDASDLKTVLQGWSEYMPTAPHELSVIMNILPPSGDNLGTIGISLCYASNDREKGMKAIEPLFNWGRMIRHHIEDREYADVLEYPGHLPEFLKVVIKSAFIEKLDEQIIETIAIHYGKVGSPMLQMRSLGGAVKDIASNDTAFAFRDDEILVSSILVIPKNMPEDDITERMTPWDELKPYRHGAYSNFTDAPTEDLVRGIYPDSTYARLAGIKKKYDPDNVFNQNRNIKPA